jgi:hypothetical protein
VREVRLTCDECGVVEIVRGYGWPNGWWHWHQRDLCHTCAVPLIMDALHGCEPDLPTVIGP